MKTRASFLNPGAWSRAVLLLASPEALSQVKLAFENPKPDAVFKAGAEVPVLLTAYAPNDFFPAAALFANGEPFAQTTYCCRLCPCAYPLKGVTTTLQIPAPYDPERPSSEPWRGWRFSTPGTYVLTAHATSLAGAVADAPPVTIRIEAIDLHLRITVSSDGMIHFVLPEGSLFPENLALETSHDLKNWQRLGPFEPGNVAAFFRDVPDPKVSTPRYYRAVSIR